VYETIFVTNVATAPSFDIWKINVAGISNRENYGQVVVEIVD
jgi:hypothetical protein